MPELDEFMGLHRAGGGRAEILKAMSDRGLTITEAIKASMRIFGIGLGDAKTLVSAHPSWIQTAEAAKPFQDDLIQAFQDASLGRKGAKGVVPGARRGRAKRGRS